MAEVTTGAMSFRKKTDPFNFWIKAVLRTRFNGVAQEPVPENLKRIITENEPSDDHAHTSNARQTDISSSCRSPLHIASK